MVVPSASCCQKCSFQIYGQGAGSPATMACTMARSLAAMGVAALTLLRGFTATPISPLDSLQNFPFYLAVCEAPEFALLRAQDTQLIKRTDLTSQG